LRLVRAENVGRGQFLDKLQPDDTAAIYFSGHGVEIEGLNFLLPRDFNQHDQVDVEAAPIRSGQGVECAPHAGSNLSGNGVTSVAPNAQWRRDLARAGCYGSSRSQ
jgi:hypothetical protein